MINFGEIEVPFILRKEDILQQVDEAQIFYRYFGPFEPGKVYPSKFRTDRNPSTGFYIGRSGQLMYNDFKTGERLNCFMFVAKMFNTDFKGALKIVAGDFGLSNVYSYEKCSLTNLKYEKKPTLIQFMPGRWTEDRVAYWRQYGITTDELRKEEVYPVNKLFVNKLEIRNLDHLCFAYVLNYEGKTYVKIYIPYGKQKWLSNIPLKIPFGIGSLKTSNHLIIGKANQKCRIILLKFFENVLGAQNETGAAMYLILEIAEDYDWKTIIWDNDETGVNNCKKFNDKGFDYFNIPAYLLERGVKDVSDYVKTFGLKSLERLLRSKGIL